MNDSNSWSVSVDEEAEPTREDDIDVLSPPTKLVIHLVGLPLSIAYIFIGALYLDDCPAQPKIPIYVIVAGSAAFIWLWLSAFQNIECSVLQSTLVCFLLCWVFFFGNMWIYQIAEPVYDQTLTDQAYCSQSLYMFAFATNTIWNFFLLIKVYLITAAFMANR